MSQNSPRQLTETILTSMLVISFIILIAMMFKFVTYIAVVGFILFIFAKSAFETFYEKDTRDFENAERKFNRAKKRYSRWK